MGGESCLVEAEEAGVPPDLMTPHLQYFLAAAPDWSLVCLLAPTAWRGGVG